MLLTSGMVIGQCPYDNIQFGTSTAPTSVGIPVDLSTCLYGGEFRRVTGLFAGATYRFETCGDTGFDTEITVYPAGGGTFLAENDDFCGVQSSVNVTLPAGGDVDVLIDEYPCLGNSTCMTLTATLVSLPGPTNDDCLSAIAVGIPSSTTGTTVGAATDTAPFCGTDDDPAGGVWYEVVGNGTTLTATTCDAGTDYDTKLRVYTGSCGALTCVGGDDDDPSCGSSTLQSTVDFFAENGVMYYILVHGYNTAEGNFVLNINCTDPCASATAMSAGTVYTGSLGLGCNNWTTYSGCGYSDLGSEAVYTFTPASSGSYTFTGTSISGDADFFLMSSCGPSGTNILGGCWDDGPQTAALTGGTTYYLIVDFWDFAGPTASYEVSVANPSPPVVSSIPASGCAGDPIAISGSNFTGTTAVAFGGVAAASFTVNSDVSITATPGTGAVSGTIAVTNAAGTGSSAGTFTVENCGNDVVVTSCGTTIYDAGGSAGNYGDGVDQYIIVYPDDPNQTLVIDGTYNVESGFDKIFISSGSWDNTSPNVLFDLELTGSGTLAPFAAYGAGEPITVRLQSDGSVNSTGFAFNVSCTCETPLSTTVSVTDAATCGGTGSIDFSNTVGPSLSTILNASFIGDAVPATMSTNGTATATGSRLRLTEAANGQAGAAVIDNSLGYTGNTFLAFYQMFVGGGSQADGYSLSFGGGIPAAPSGGEESGYGNGLVISFDTYNNGAGGYQWGGSNQVGIYLVYNGSVLAFSPGASWRNTWTSVELVINDLGELTLEVSDVPIFTGVALPAGYTSADKSNWDVAFAARTGGSNDEHSIDNINITFGNQFEYSVNGGASWQTSTAFPALAVGPYTPAVRYLNNTACFGTTPVVNVNEPAPPVVSITGDASLCDGGTTTLSPGSGGNWVSNNLAVASVSATTGAVAAVGVGSADFTFTSSTTNCSATTSPVTVVGDPVWSSNSFSPASGSSICESTPVTFSASVSGGLGGSISWIRSTSPGGSGTTVSSPDLAPPGGVVYYRPQFAASGSGCNLADGTESNLTIQAQPTADIVSYDYTCLDGLFSFNGAPTTGNWSVVAGTGSLITSPAPGSVSMNNVPPGSTTTVRYTVPGGVCPDAEDDQVVDYLTSLTVPAGGVLSTCNPNPSGGMQFWASPEGEELFAGIDPQGNTLGTTNVEVPGSAAIATPASYWGGLGDVPEGIYGSATDPVRMPAGDPACPSELFVEDVLEIDVSSTPSGNDPVVRMYILQFKWEAFVDNGNAWLDDVPGRRVSYNTCYGGFPAMGSGPSLANVAVTGYHADGRTLHTVSDVTPVGSGPTAYYSIEFSTDRFSTFALHGAGSGDALPITLVAFWGEHIQGVNHLHWETATESNTSHFVLERSQDGLHFTDFATVEAAGHSTAPQSYDALDAAPFQSWTYYRLRSVDLDGAFAHSEIVALSAEQPSAGEDRYLAIVPNPFTHRFAVRFYQPLDGPYRITITDALGRTVREMAGQLSEGLNDVPVDLGENASGTYMVRVQRADGMTLLQRAVRSTD